MVHTYGKSLPHAYIHRERERERHVNVYIHIICTCVIYIYIYMHTCNIPTLMWVLHQDDFRLATSIFWKLHKAFFLRSVRLPLQILSLRTYIHTYTHTCMHAWMRTSIHPYIHTNIQTYIFQVTAPPSPAPMVTLWGVWRYHGNPSPVWCGWVGRRLNMKYIKEISNGWAVKKT